MHFGVDDGPDFGIAGDEILHDDEVRESLKICSEQLYEGLWVTFKRRVTNGFANESVWSQTWLLCFPQHDGTNGCELWILDEENVPSLLMDIHVSGDAIPGKRLGFMLLIQNVVQDSSSMLMMAFMVERCG